MPGSGVGRVAADWVRALIIRLTNEPIDAGMGENKIRAAAAAAAVMPPSSNPQSRPCRHTYEIQI